MGSIIYRYHFPLCHICIFKINIVNIELYTDTKDPSVEQKVESVLDANGIFYDKTEVWIESEKLYEVLYQFELEVNNNGE